MAVIQIDAFLRYVRSKGFDIKESNFTGKRSEIKRFVISNSASHAYLDFDMAVWGDLTQEYLMRQADIAMETLKSNG